MQVMPLLAEMPAGSLGQQAISRAVYITVMGIAVAAYGVMGVFAAARFVQPFDACVCITRPQATCGIYVMMDWDLIKAQVCVC